MKNWIFGAIASCLLFNGCNTSTEVNEAIKDCEDYIYTDSISKAPVYGYVSDIEGNAIEGAMVTTGKDTVFTSETGLYTFANCRAVNGRSVIKFESADFFSVVRTAQIEEGETRVDALLMPQDSKEGVTEVARFQNSVGSTIKVGNMSVFIPANSLVYEGSNKEFNGSVFASVYYLNPNSETFTKEMPGGDMSGVTASGKEVILLSYGMVEVTLKDSANQKLQLKDGAESSLTFPVPEGFSEKQLYDKIPLWYFDEEKGTWVEEGVATKNGNTYSGNIKHFSWHNLDWPSVRASICGRVTNKKGDPLPGVLVTISQTSARTDANGNYCAYVPNNTPVFVTVKPSDYAGYTNCPIYKVDGLPATTTYTQDIVLPNMLRVHGKVTDEDDNPLRYFEVTSNKSTVATDRYGEYSMYIKGDERVSFTVGKNGVLNAPKYKTYTFDDPMEIDENESYDFKVQRPINVYGYVANNNRRPLRKGVRVTVLVDGKEYKVKSTDWWSIYSFRVARNTKDVTTYVTAKDGTGLESNRVSCSLANKKYNWQSLSTIYLPSAICITGSVYNTCGPSKIKSTIVVGRGKDKQVYTNYSNFGYIDLTLPLSMKNSKVKVKIDCMGKRITKKVDLDSEDIDLGNIEVCSGEKPDPNCIYALIGDKTIKFDTRKDLYTEMYQRTGPDPVKYSNAVYKYQAIYKNKENKETLVLAIEPTKDNNKVQLTTSLISDKFLTDKKSVRVPYKKDSIYTFKTDFELDSPNEEDEIYIYGSADIVFKNFKDNIDRSFFSDGVYRESNKITVGSSNDTKFYTVSCPNSRLVDFESVMKKKGLKEKTTFLNDEQMVSSIFVGDNAEAVINRSKDRYSEVTVLFREGIGKEPLYSCWKVDFRKSSLKNKGSNIDYMWKNEADIAHLVMFGPLMGIEFTKTDIKENKCGCTTGNGPTVAN
ncbi:MAG: carboxypeptidase-like regulatory domain-containing protein [Paludibacteraceae bacterium]|nr:carboxypeptidase-like regulatory domain-containing protein [Paludibacteraceae bacterium]